MTAIDWMGRADCRDLDPELWFADASHPNGDVAIALQICDGCPVKAECAEYALSQPVQGVWGGLTESQRRTLRRKRGSIDTRDPWSSTTFAEHGTPGAVKRHYRRKEPLCDPCQRAQTRISQDKKTRRQQQAAS